MANLILSFICKNEEKVVEEMLTSALYNIDAIVAFDTGSTDSTIAIIEQFGRTHNIPTLVYHGNFVDYSTARNELINHTKAACFSFGFLPAETYWISNDCDDLLIIDPSFDINLLSERVYKFRVITPSGLVYCKNMFVRCDADAHWEGIVHEHLVSTHKINYIDEIYIQVLHRGDSWNADLQEKYMRQSMNGEISLLNDPYNTRTVFFCGETNLFVGTEESYRRAEYFFNKRIEIGGGNTEEIFYSYLQLANIYRSQNKTDLYISTLLKAYDAEPRRAESLFQLSKFYMEIGQPNLAFIYSSIMMRKHCGINPIPELELYIFADLYKYIIAFEHIIIANAVGDIDSIVEAHKYTMSIFDILPDWAKINAINNEHVLKNLG